MPDIAGTLELSEEDDAGAGDDAGDDDLGLEDDDVHIDITNLDPPWAYLRVEPPLPSSTSVSPSTEFFVTRFLYFARPY